MDMAKTRLEKNGVKYSVPVYGYVAPSVKAEMDLIRDIDPSRHSNSQLVQDALAQYVPRLRARLGLSFKAPTHGTPSRRRRKAA
jgi:hypothetical protein